MHITSWEPHWNGGLNNGILHTDYVIVYVITFNFKYFGGKEIDDNMNCVLILKVIILDLHIWYPFIHV
jgi:hypothetical protein